jgi:hypothetical protein
MSGERIANDIYFPCPMVNRDMCEGECYDVQMVLSHFITENALDFKMDRETAKVICSDCQYNQLTSPEVSRRSQTTKALAS